jgi:hypothetical protein
MSGPRHPNGGSGQHNQQVNQSTGSGPFYANQGGKQSIKNYTNAAARTWTGWVVLVLLVVDVGFFFYGKGAYTGQEGNTGDLWRAGIFLVLAVSTVSMIRKWVRSRL